MKKRNLVSETMRVVKKKKCPSIISQEASRYKYAFILKKWLSCWLGKLMCPFVLDLLKITSIIFFKNR